MYDPTVDPGLTGHGQTGTRWMRICRRTLLFSPMLKNRVLQVRRGYALSRGATSRRACTLHTHVRTLALRHASTRAQAQYAPVRVRVRWHLCTRTRSRAQTSTQHARACMYIHTCACECSVPTSQYKTPEPDRRACNLACIAVGFLHRSWLRARAVRNCAL